MNFVESTHYKHWTFTDKQLAERREANREKAIATIKALRESGQEEAKPAAENGAKPKKKGKSKPISLEDEAKLLRYYSSKISGFCQTIKLPAKVKATAQIYLKRFFLIFSTLDYSPALLSIACTYLAGKVEESYISAEALANLTRQNESVILELEPILLEGLNLELIVYTPLRSLASYIQILSEEGKASDEKSLKALGGKEMDTVKAKAMNACDILLTTDAPLIFTPGQIALAAIRSALKNFPGTFDLLLEKVLEAKEEKEKKEKGEALKAVLGQIDKFGMEGASTLDADEIKKIDRQLKLFHNLVNDPSSQEYQKHKEAKKAKENEAKAEKRAAKRARIQESSLDLLGSSLRSSGLLSMPSLDDPALVKT